MRDDHAELLRRKLAEADFQKLTAIGNARLLDFVAGAVELCQPGEVLVLDDSPEAMTLTRNRAVEASEETPLAIRGRNHCTLLKIFSLAFFKFGPYLFFLCAFVFHHQLRVKLQSN